MWGLFSVPPSKLKNSVQEETTTRILALLTIANYQSALWIHNVTKYEETTRVQMVYAVTTQTLPRRSSPSQCHMFHGTRVNVILLTTVIKVGPSLSADLLYWISQNSVRRYGKYGYTFIYLSAASLTAFTFRNSYSTFLWTPPTLNFIQNERKFRNCGGKKSLAPLCKEWLSRYQISRNSAAQGHEVVVSDTRPQQNPWKNVANTERNSRTP
jgi:hypothetical protein